MSSTLKTVILIVGIGLLALVLLTNVFGNLYGLLAEKDWFIPEGSSVFEFKATVMGKKTDGGWIYGEDGEKYYYAGVTPYVLIPKSNNCSEFDPRDYRTWCEIEIPEHEGYPR